MARKRPVRDGGTVVVLEHRSSILADNPLGDSEHLLREPFSRD